MRESTSPKVGTQLYAPKAQFRTGFLFHKRTIASFGTEQMGRRQKGFISWIFSAAFWLAEKLWGDELFAYLKLVIPAEWQSLPFALHVLWAWVVPISLFLLGAYIFWPERVGAGLPNAFRAWLKGPIKWDFMETGNIVALEWTIERRDLPTTYYAPGVIYWGRNISAHTIYRLNARMVLDRDNSSIVLETIKDGQPAPLSTLPPIKSGHQTVIRHWLPGRPSVDEFMQQIGAFRLEVTCDGKTRSWRFSLQMLRRQFARQIEGAEQQRLHEEKKRLP